MTVVLYVVSMAVFLIRNWSWDFIIQRARSNVHIFGVWVKVYGTKLRICDLLFQLLYDAIYQQQILWKSPTLLTPQTFSIFSCFLVSYVSFSAFLLLSHLVTGNCFYVFFVTNLIARSPLRYLFIVAHTILCQLSFPLCPHDPSLFSCFSQPLINIPCSLPVSERMNEKEVGTEREMWSEGGREGTGTGCINVSWTLWSLFLDGGPRALLSHLS